MGFLNLVAAAFHLLAWPLITLVYPLYASVGAIESNSLAESQKWLTYWVLCGLIMLFEFLSSSLIEWLPFWSHTKVAITLWLVFPYFGGAAYAYDRFVRPCFVFDPRSLKIGYWLISKRDDSRIRNSGDFLLLVEKYVQEKGSEALEELVFGKAKYVQPTLSGAKTNAPVSMNNKESEASKMIKFGQIEYTAVVTSSNNKAEVVSGVSELSQLTIPNEDQKEWTCELCQVCAPSEAVLHNHLQGKKHKTKERELMESTAARIDEKVVTATGTKSTGAEVAGVVYEQPESSSIQDRTQKEWACALCQVCTQSENSLESHLQGETHKAKVKMLMEATLAQIDAKAVLATINHSATIAEVVSDIHVPPGSSSFIPDIIQKEWACSLCQVWTPSEDSLRYHLQGNAHTAKEKKLKESTYGQAKDKEVPATENKSTIIAEVVDGVRVRPGSSSSIPDITEKERTCALCYLCMGSEASLQHHLQGKKHRAKEKELMDLIRTDDKAVAATESKSTEAEVASSVFEHTGSSFIADKPQIKWYCALCQLSTQSEASLHTHLQGKAHRAKEEELNAGKPKVTPVERVPSPIPKVTNVKKSENVTVGGTEIGNQRGQTNPDTKPTTDLSALWCDKCKLQCKSLSSLNDHLVGKRHLWCDKCKLQCNSLSMLNDHLLGKRHLWCEKCKLQCNSLSMMNDHLHGKQHLWCDKRKLQCNSLSMLTDHLSGQRHLSRSGTSVIS